MIVIILIFSRRKKEKIKQKLNAMIYCFFFLFVPRLIKQKEREKKTGSMYTIDEWRWRKHNKRDNHHHVVFKRFRFVDSRRILYFFLLLFTLSRKETTLSVCHPSLSQMYYYNAVASALHRPPCFHHISLIISFLFDYLNTFVYVYWHPTSNIWGYYKS